MKAILREVRPTLALGLPIIIGQVGQHLMPLIDTAMIGRVGYEQVAAAAFGSTVLMVPMIIGFGLCLPVSVMVASGRGSGDAREPALVLQHGLILTGIYTLLLCVGLTAGVLCGMLGWFGQDAVVVEHAYAYALYLLWSIPAIIAWTCLKNYCEAMCRPWLSLWSLGLGLLLNILLNWVFIFGKLGFPEMGVAGAGLATGLSRFFVLGVLGWMIWRRASLRPVLPLAEWWKLSKARVKQLLGLGIPSGVQILFEIGVFVYAMIAMGWISPAAQAAHQIAINVAALAFMMPLGLSFAAGIRVGEARGRGDFTAIRRIGWSCLLLAWGFMGLYAVGVLLLRHEIPVWFVEEAEVHALASSFLMVAAAFALFDGTQITAIGILRGMYDVRIPTAAVFISYWILSAPLATWLAFRTDLGGVGLWLGLMVGLGFAGLFLISRFLWITAPSRTV